MLGPRRSTRSGTPRHRPYLDIGHVVRELLAAGPRAIHSNRTIAAYMFGADDSQLLTRDIRRARTMADKIVATGLPLCPCDEQGTLLDTEEQHDRASRGKTCLWRFDPYGNVISDALHEAMGDVPPVKLAIGVLALESAPIREGWEEAAILLEAIRGVLPPAAMAAVERELAARRQPGGQRGTYGASIRSH
jgi:hypothetical protein